MLFQFNITLTEEDYLAFNQFHAFESAQGKKMVTRSRLFITFLVMFALTVIVLVRGLTLYSAIVTVFLGLVHLIYMLVYKKILIRSLKAQIKRMEKTGRLPYDSESTLAFYEDKLVETSASTCVEQKYSIIEKMCVVKDRYIYLYNSSTGAYILPISQIQAQANWEDLMAFLRQICNTVEYY